MADTYWELSKLREWDRNPRSISKDGFERLKKQIKKLGQYKPLLITPDGTVLGGNMRLKAYRELGVDKVWVSIIDPKTEAEKLEYSLSDNDRAGYYDDDLLANLSSYYSDFNWEDYSVDLRDPTNLRQLLDQFVDTVEDEAPEVDPDQTFSKVGEVYQLGKHRLLCGDTTRTEDVSLLMDQSKANMVFTDPPYNVDYTGGMGGDGSKHKRKPIANDKMSTTKFYDFLLATMSNLVQVTDGAFYVCMSSSELHNLWKAFTDAGGHWQTYIIWAKDSFTLSRSDYQHQFEPIMHGLTDSAVTRADNEVDEDKLPIMYGWTKHAWYGGRKQGDVWRFDRPKVSKDHPVMKPVALCAKAIVNSSKRDEIVLDVFGGSGSTLIACEQLDRRCYMMELDPKYCDVIRKRYANFIQKGDQWQTVTPKV